MKIYHKTMIALFLSAIFILPAISQEKEGKTIKIKIVKEDDGQKTVIDTVLDITGLEDLKEMEALKELLGEDVMEGITIDMDSLENELNIEIEKIDGDHGALDHNAFVFMDGDKGDLNEKIEMLMENLDKEMNLDSLKNELDKLNNSFIYEYILESDSGVDGNKYKTIIKSGHHGKSGKNVMFFSDDVGDTLGDVNVEVEIAEGGKRMIVKENGATREYLLKEGQGAYFIDDDGNVEKLEDGDMEWHSKSGDHDQKHSIVDSNCEKKIVIVKKFKSDKDVKVEGNQKVIVWHEDNDDVDAEGDHEVYVEVVIGEGGSDKKMIKHEIVIKSLEDEDYAQLGKAGITSAPKTDQKLKISNFTLRPEREDGSYELKFATDKGNKTSVYLIDGDGKMIFKEKLKDFEGSYEKEIDLKKNAGEPIFMLIKQDDKYTARKIYVE